MYLTVIFLCKYHSQFYYPCSK